VNKLTKNCRQFIFMYKLVQIWHEDPRYWFLVLLLIPVFLLLIFGLSIDTNLGQIFHHPFQFFYLIIILPIVEELAFRGFLQGYLLKYNWALSKIVWISYANLLTSIFFALAHLLHQAIFWSVAVILPSLAFGYLRERFNLLRPAIELHIIYNFCYFLIFYQSAS
jgi:membrane protease YdiL (CAAX protease family)